MDPQERINFQRLADTWDRVKHLGESETERKLRRGQGQIAYFLFPDHDGRANAIGIITEGPLILRESDRRIPYFKHLEDKKVEIPANCHSKDGCIDWTKVQLKKDGPGVTDYSVVLISEE